MISSGKPLKILSTKVLSAINRKEIIKNDFHIVEHNFIKINNINFTLDTNDVHVGNTLIFTSQNSVRSVIRSKYLTQLKLQNVFCVGQKTKKLLLKNGFNVIIYADYAEDLADVINNRYNKESFVFFCGNIRNEILPQVLRKANIKYREIQVYITILNPKTIEISIDFILFFSHSAVESYLISNNIDHQLCFCIGKTTAKALKKYTSNIIIAEFPTIENVIKKVLIAKLRL